MSENVDYIELDESINLNPEKPLKPSTRTLRGLQDREVSVLIGSEERFTHKDSNDTTNWITRLFTVRGTVLFTFAMFVRVAFFSSISIMLMLLKQFGVLSVKDPRTNITTNLINFKPTGHALLGAALGLLLVYRTNSSYDRFWEGRKLWCSLFSNCRDLIRVIKAWDPQSNLVELRNLIFAFAVTIRQRLRREQDQSKFEKYLTKGQMAFVLNCIQDDPYAITYLITEWVMRNCPNTNANTGRVGRVDAYISGLIVTEDSMDRIMDTPIPLSYVAHINHVVFIFLLSLPFCMIEDLGWYSVPMQAMVSFGMLGIEDAGAEIEYPFGTDKNDIPIDDLIQRLSAMVHKFAVVKFQS